MARRLLVLLTVLTALVVGGATLGNPVVTAQVPPPLGPEPPGEEPAPPPADPPPPAQPAPEYPPLPEDSGTGKRVVYSVSQQRVWLVEQDERVSSSYLVSGRKGIPKAGTYKIYSRSRWSSANRGRVRMEFMMRFVKPRRGGQAIGFHAIPVDRQGRQIQSDSELGQPRSKGCVRQSRADAEHLWHWAQDGTTVRVTP